MEIRSVNHDQEGQDWSVRRCFGDGVGTPKQLEKPCVPEVGSRLSGSDARISLFATLSRKNILIGQVGGPFCPDLGR